MSRSRYLREQQLLKTQSHNMKQIRVRRKVCLQERQAGERQKRALPRSVAEPLCPGRGGALACYGVQLDCALGCRPASFFFERHSSPNPQPRGPKSTAPQPHSPPPALRCSMPNPQPHSPAALRRVGAVHRLRRGPRPTCKKNHHLLICISGLFSGAKRQAEAEGCANRTLSSEVYDTDSGRPPAP